MGKTQVCRVLVLLVDGEKEQCEKVSRKVRTSPRTSRRKTECVLFAIFQELMK